MDGMKSIPYLLLNCFNRKTYHFIFVLAVIFGNSDYYPGFQLI